jgi:nucleotide-binding universal stress UspA family protein
MSMYKRIMVPVDLAHAAALDKAIQTAADLARHYGGALVLVGATGSEPSSVARSPQEFAARLADFAKGIGDRFGVPASSDALHLHDVTIDLDPKLAGHADKIGADLIVMASHVPGVADYLFGSNAGKLAQHAKMSVMVVRP